MYCFWRADAFTDMHANENRHTCRKLTMTVLLLDIEGTVCPITFVKDVLFPYFLDQLPTVLSKQSFPLTGDEPISSILQKLPNDVKVNADSIHSHFTNLVNRDVKDPILKSLQGLIWKLGYASGELKAPIYPDSIEYIKDYSGKIYIYSSGSVQAQKLLFGHVQNIPGEAQDQLDLNPYLSGYFDITTSGFKYEKSSYEQILKAIDVRGDDVLFLSDNVAEVKAAIGAGLGSYLVERPGNAPISDDDRKLYRVIKSLDELRK